MRVLITGAAGFYGSHLVNNLLRKDDTTEIIGVDSFDRKKDFPLDPFDIVDDKRAFEERFTILASDFRDLDATKIDSLQVDCVIHLAALVSIPESMVKPEEQDPTISHLCIFTRSIRRSNLYSFGHEPPLQAKKFLCSIQASG